MSNALDALATGVAVAALEGVSGNELGPTRGGGRQPAPAPLAPLAAAPARSQPPPLNIFPLLFSLIFLAYAMLLIIYVFQCV